MPQKQNPTGQGGASRNSFGGASCETSTRFTTSAQYLIARHAVRPVLAELVAGFAFGGGQAHG